MKRILLLLLVFHAVLANAQKRELVDNYDEITITARQELDTAMMAPEGELYSFAQKNKISGSYVIDLTIHEKGEVLSVFVVSNSSGNITSQNILKDFLQYFKFNFKMPKGKRYKFQYDFTFN